MNETNIEIKITKDCPPPTDPKSLENVIYEEDSEGLCYVSQITLSGKYDKTFSVISHYIPMSETRILVDGNLFIVCLTQRLVIIDLNTGKTLRVIDFEFWELFDIYKFKSGYFLYCEQTNRFYNGNFELVWDGGCCDIFVNFKLKRYECEICEDYISVFDWAGYEHFYNEDGEFDVKYHPQYDCNK